MDTFVSRRALVYGATGLIGRALLAQLLVDYRYGEVHVLARRPRAAVAGIADHPRLIWHVVDFARLPEALPSVDDVFCCIGSTIKTAGSKPAFQAVDCTLVVQTARTLRRRGAERLAVVSALGADAHSGIFYNRVKGEMEAAVRQLGYAALVIARPSLLAGDRAATGQPRRIGERLALAVFGPLMGVLPARLRPIAAATVAAALRSAVAAGQPGVRVIASAELQQLGQPSPS